MSLEDLTKRPADPFVQKEIGRVYIQRWMANGDRGNVYFGNMTHSKHEVAVRLVKPEFVRGPGALAELLHNMQALQKVKHPNVVGLVEAGDAKGQVWIASDFVRGDPLKAHMRRDGKLDFDKATTLVRDIARGLEAIHAAGVVHGDLRPSSIIIDPSGHPKINGAGLPRLHEEASAEAGECVAPELLEGRAPDVRSDLFSLGCIYYALLTGEYPFESVEARLKEGPKANAEIPPRAQKVLDKLLARRPEDRLSGARETAGSLDRAWYGRDPEADPTVTGTKRRAAPPARKPRVKAPSPAFSPVVWTPPPKVRTAYAFYLVAAVLVGMATFVRVLPAGARWGLAGAALIPTACTAWLLFRQKARLRGVIAVTFFAGALVLLGLGAQHAPSPMALFTKLNGYALGGALVVSVGLACVCDLKRGWLLRLLLPAGMALVFFGTWAGGSITAWMLAKPSSSLPLLGGSLCAALIALTILNGSEVSFVLRAVGFVIALGAVAGIHLVAGTGEWPSMAMDLGARVRDQGTVAVFSVVSFLVGHLVLKSFE